MDLKERVTQELETLTEAELGQVADYLAFLKFQARIHAAPSFDVAEVAALYAEFAEEDRLLAEEGMAEYNAGLLAEDVQE